MQNTVRGLISRFGLTDSKGKSLKETKLCPQLQARGAVRKALADLGIRSDSKHSKKGKQGDRVLFTRRLDAKDDESLTAGDFSIVVLEETYEPRAKGGVETVHHEVQRVRYDSTAKQIGLETDLFATEIKAGFRKYGQAYTGTDIARVIANLIEHGHGFLVRESGGVYLVPSGNQISDAAKALCDTIPGAKLTRWELFDFEGGEQHVQAREMAGVSIRRELAALRADLEETAKRAKDPTLRTGTVARRIQTVKTLKVRVQTYRELLGLEDAKLKEGLNECLRAAKKIMDANVEAKELAKQGNASKAA